MQQYIVLVFVKNIVLINLQSSWGGGDGTCQTAVNMFTSVYSVVCSVVTSSLPQTKLQFKQLIPLKI